MLTLTVPDLVFSEMRFLQRPKNNQDHSHATDETRTATKPDKQRRIEQEISTYFADAAQVACQVDTVPPIVAAEQHSERDHSRERREPPMELPDNRLLGFGRKGTQTHAKTKTSEGHYTWSESLPRSPDRPELRRHSVDRRATRAVKRPINGQVRNTAQKSKHSQRSQSLPQEYPSEPSVQAPLFRRTDRQQNVEDAFQTSDILRVDTRPSISQNQQHNKSASTSAPRVEVENHLPQCSTPTSKLIRQARIATVMPQMVKTIQSLGVPSHRTTPALPERRLLPTSRHCSASHPVVADGMPTRLPFWTERAHTQALDARVFPIFDDEEGMLHDHHDDGNSHPKTEVYATVRQAEQFAYGDHIGDESGVYEHTPSEAFTEATGAVERYTWPEHDMTHIADDWVTNMPSMKGHTLSRLAMPLPRSPSQAKGGMPGFWWPNRLY
jgi:hypothetical protein